jgi:hypothetical protein
MRRSVRNLPAILLAVCLSTCDSGCVERTTTGTESHVNTCKLREILNAVDKKSDVATGWFLPATMMEEPIENVASGTGLRRTLLVAIESDRRFAVRQIGATPVIVPRGMKETSSVAISHEFAPSPVFGKTVAFTEAMETDLGSLCDLLLHDLAKVSSTGDFNFKTVPDTWSIRLPNATIMDVLQLIGAASGARIRVADEHVELRAPPGPGR